LSKSLHLGVPLAYPAGMWFGAGFALWAGRKRGNIPGMSAAWIFTLIAARATRLLARVGLPVAAVLMLASCGQAWNNPYLSSEKGQNTLYSSFVERPKHLDPAVSFTSDESQFTYQVYEMAVQYHYLKRPYELMPQLAESVPVPQLYDKTGKRLPDDASPSDVAYTIYEVKVRKGVQFAPHPAFVPENRKLTQKEIDAAYRLSDFSRTGTRELTADDFVYQIKRLAHPRVDSPILSLMGDYIVGLDAFSKLLKTEDDKLVAAQGKGAWLDLRKFDFEGAKVIDRYTYQVKITGLYPQFIYWMAMPFFTAIPYEAEQFYAQKGLADHNITLDWYPVGTGPYQLVENNPNARMTLVRNPNFRGETYPADGEAGDEDKGLLADAGQKLPFIDRVVFTREKEGIPLWNKFLQGYYDMGGITNDSFDQAVRIETGGGAMLTGDMEKRGVQLRTTTTGLTYYLGFNQTDSVVGKGKTPEEQARNRKLRQAVSVVFDWDEYITIFLNGRGVPAQGPIPPGMFGFSEGKDGINPVVYDWDGRKAVRKPIEAAKKLLAEAGYPNGRDAKTGAPLVLYLDSTLSGPSGKATLDWYRKQLAKLDVQLEIRTTDWNRYQEKIRKGNTQLFILGWDADYPDPENFFFLLYGPNSAVKSSGENKVNYENPEFDKLFEQMKAMQNTPERAAIIRKMLEILRQDAPWVFGFHPKSFNLFHGWMGNMKPNHFARGNIKYLTVQPAKRDALRQDWNPPIVGPLGFALFLLVLFALPAIRTWKLRETRSGKGGVGRVDDDERTRTIAEARAAGLIGSWGGATRTIGKPIGLKG
jgi:oligopeptide transport system substrate-binding protein